MTTIYTVLDQTTDVGLLLVLWLIVSFINFLIHFFIKVQYHHKTLFRYLIPVILGIIFIYIGKTQRDSLQYFQNKLIMDEVEIIEGQITAYNAIRYGIKGYESFVLNEKLIFKYPAKGYDYIGYDITKRSGSVLKKGMRIKIWHLNGRILRLDKL